MDEISQLTAGLPDDAFVTDGLLTKRVLRAYALAVLAPRAGDLLWDLGAGTGSIGLEWCRLHPSNRAVAVERHDERAGRIVENARRLAVESQIGVRIDSIGSALDDLPDPDAVFIGGGVTWETISRSFARLESGGRLVAHSVTADSDAVLLHAHEQWGGELVRVGVELAEPIGRFTGFRPLRTVTSWALVKPQVDQ